MLDSLQSSDVARNAPGSITVRRRRRLHLLAGFFVLATLLAGSARAQDPNGTPAPASQATDILRATSKKLAETPSLHFTLDINGDAYIDDQHTIRLIEADGDVVRPDKVVASFKVNVLNTVNATISMITIGDQHWSTDLISGKWISAPSEFSYDPGVLFDNTHGIGPVMDQVTNATLVGEESLDGKNVYHIHADVPQSIIGDLTSNTMEGDPISVDLWIDSTTSDLLRVQLAEPKDNGKDHPATWTLDLSKHGESIEINPPS
jgi:LppX/LprAFG-like lipoprotein